METTIAEKLRDRAIDVELRPIATLSSSSTLPLGRSHTWLLTETEIFPAVALERVQKHLAQGGELLVMGKVPFEQLTYLHHGNWLTQQGYLREVTTATALFPEVTTDYCAMSLDHNTSSAELTVVRGDFPPAGGSAGQALHMNVPFFASWCTFRTPAPGIMPQGDLTAFWAKGTTDTRKLAIEWQEHDASRWIATVDLTPGWKYYVLKPEDFNFWNDNTSRGRGGSGDHVNLQNVSELAIGLAQTHTKLNEGPHNFWVADIGVAVSDGKLKNLLVQSEIEGLYPANKVYPMEPAAVSVSPAYTTPSAQLEVPVRAWSPYWRPMGSGIDKARRHRFIPVVTATNSQGSRAGTVASMMLHFDGKTSGAITGSIGIPDSGTLTSDGWMDIAAQMIERMQHRLLFTEAGATEYCYDVRDLTEIPVVFGYSVLMRKTAEADSRGDVQTTLSVAGGDVISSASSAVENRVRHSHDAGADAAAESLITSQTLVYEANLLRDGEVVDYISQEIRFEHPPSGSGQFVTARDNRFWIGDIPWRVFGINYMPSSGLALSNGQEFEYWLEDPAYDPDIVQADLERVKEAGFNMVSVFAYSRDNDRLNLLHLLQRCCELDLMVNLSLRPNLNPWPAKKNVTDRLINEIRAWERDEIMAYDVAWEPWWGNASRRMKYKDAWISWVEATYGSAAEAAKVWGFTPEDLASFPSDKEINVDGPWRQAVHDYRRFAHGAINAAYKETYDNIRAIDPNHLVSFRQSEGGNPLVSPASFPVELFAICDAVDFFSPEGYGIGDAPEKAKTFWFTSAYAQGLAPGKPVLLAEYGASVWSGSAFDTDVLLYQRQAQVYENIYNAAEAARAAGTVLWWFPGGYRKYEESDYGLLNSDGTDRPGTIVVREWADKLKRYPPDIEWQGELIGDAAGVRGYVGMYEQLKDEFFDMATTGSLPVVKRAENVTGESTAHGR